MKEQKYIIKKGDSFEAKHIFECGQCFRWNVETDGSYTGIVNNSVINVKHEKDNIIFTGISDKNLKDICDEYFDLNTNYENIKENLSTVDDNLKLSINYGNGIRILKQDLWETLISFIISANNNIPRIKGIIERISKKYGNEMIWKDRKFYTFPSVQQLSVASIEDLRALGTGFRDKYIYKTTQMVLKKEVKLEDLKKENDIEKIRKELSKFPGVGDKVADCIMLFALKKFEVFPVDVWVRRVMNELYIKEEDEKKVNKEQIRELARREICKSCWNRSAIFILLETRSIKSLMNYIHQTFYAY